MRLLTSTVCLLSLILSIPAQAQVVTKTADSFEFGSWKSADYNTTGGTIAIVQAASPDSGTQKSLSITPTYSGSFGGFAVAPVRPLVIPGETRSITLIYKAGDKRHGLKVDFVDGWGRSTVDKKPLEWNVPTDPSLNWQKSTFTIPADWVQPISIAKIGTHNWNTQSEKNAPTFLIDQIDVQTDIARVDPKTGFLTSWRPDPSPDDKTKTLRNPPAAPLVDVTFSTTAEANVFMNTPPRTDLLIRNWKADPLAAKATITLSTDKQSPAPTMKKDFTVDSLAGFEVPLEVKRFGLYSAEAKIAFADGTSDTSTLALAYLPQQPQLTPQQRNDSPYGLNYHGAGRRMIGTFRKAGLVWFREYAFSKPHLMQAKGSDGKYANWPFFNRMMQAYAENDALVVACLQQWMQPPVIGNDARAQSLGPDQQWVKDLAHVMISFPQITHWEAGNEYDLNQKNQRLEEAVQWENYQRYHARLAEMVKLLVGDKGVTIENGRAGIFPELVADSVKSGHFAGVDVINSHHYCGTDAPELNFFNFNTSPPL